MGTVLRKGNLPGSRKVVFLEDRRASRRVDLGRIMVLLRTEGTTKHLGLQHLSAVVAQTYLPSLFPPPEETVVAASGQLDLLTCMQDKLS